MLIMAVAPAYHLSWMFALTVVVTAEKLMERPRYVTRMTATALAITAIVVVGMMLASVPQRASERSDLGTPSSGIGRERRFGT